MVVGGCGRGGGCGRSHGHDSEGACGWRDQGPRHCAHCGRNNQTSDKYWDKFGKLKWTQIANTMSTSISTATSSSTASIVQIFQLDYKCFLQLHTSQVSQLANTTLHGSASGMSTFIASSNKN